MPEYFESQFYGADLDKAFGILLDGDIELADQRAKEAAKSAKEAKASEESAHRSSADAELSKRAIENLVVEGATLPAGSQVAVEKSVAVDGTVTLKFFVPQGKTGEQGNQGASGASIASIERTSGTGAAGTVDTYTITLSNGGSSTFQVYNGADGDGAGDMLAAVYDPTGRAQDVFAYVDAADIDCGLFGEAGPVMLHNAAAGAHALLSVDGNVLEAGAGDAALTEHERNPLAHQNLILDGNQG